MYTSLLDLADTEIQQVLTLGDNQTWESGVWFGNKFEDYLLQPAAFYAVGCRGLRYCRG
jgi:hypothetical protein